MNTLPKEKRAQLALACIITLLVMGGLYFGLIRRQQETLRGFAKKLEEAHQNLDRIQETRKRSANVEAELAIVTAALARLEENMASGDRYLWMLNTVRQFKKSYEAVDILQYSTIVEGTTTLLPRFPYRQAKMSVSGTAFYHDLGRFIADLENQFLQVRIQNLELSPAADKSSDERLLFKMEIVTLVKPDN